MIFGYLEKSYFGATDGAYSVVTEDEYNKQQITITGHEKEIVLSYFDSDSIIRGSVKNHPEYHGHEFKLYPEYEDIQLNINFPKSTGNELRLYIPDGRFRPVAGKNWFVFLRDEGICIGAMSIGDWHNNVLENYDDQYQDDVQSHLAGKNVPSRTSYQGERYQRDPAVAADCLRSADYICEIDESHVTFVSRRTGENFVEAHHLIPVSAQDDFSHSLDVPLNIFSLCPNCHRAIHHGKSQARGDLAAKLFSLHAGLGDDLGVDILGVLKYYE